jgi:CheY-like chemotaxis protein
MGADYTDKDTNVRLKIAVVSKSGGYLLGNLANQLTQDGFDTYSASNLSTLNKLGNDLNGCLLYLDEDFIEDDKLMIFIRDKVNEDEVPVFLVGDEGEIAVLKKFIPQRLVSLEFLRPINIKSVADDIRKFYETHKSDKRKLILAVDDSGVMLKSIKNWLGDKYDMMLADSALAAIKSITVNRPDLIILDYEMPIIDGKKTIAMIRAEKDFADIPVIFLTGRQDRESIEDVMEYKPNGYLLKSMKPYAVRKYIDEFFEKLDNQKKLDSIK